MRLERQSKLCTEHGCGRDSCARGLCRSHYQKRKSSNELPPLRTYSISQRLEAGHVKDEETGCWLWAMSKDTAGYGLVTVSTGKSGAAHRAAYIAFVGEIPSGYAVCHACDTPACIRPDHLFLGTQRDNMRDASAKGRRNTSLTQEQAAEVRASNESAQAIAKRLGVGTHVIYKCRRGVTYPSSKLLGESNA